ncbi:MAG: hypothetical protein ACD_4C00218G0001, partial [uncultured bacterium (gcode 4)]
MNWTPEQKQEVNKDSSHKVELAAVWTVIAWWEWKVSEDSGDNKEMPDTWNSGVILWARTYQLWHSTIRPFENMNTLEQNHIIWRLKWIFSRDPIKKDFAIASSEISKLEKEFEILKNKANPSIDELVDITFKESKINAIKAWPQAYREFLILVERGPEIFIKNIEDLDVSRIKNADFLKSSKRLRAGDINEFKRIQAEVQILMDDEWVLVKWIQWEIDMLSKEKLNLSNEMRTKWIDHSAKISEIDNSILKKSKNIWDIEERVKLLFGQFKNQNERFLVDQMINNWAKLKTSGRYKELIWRDLELNDLKIQPDKKIFRFWTYKWA